MNTTNTLQEAIELLHDIEGELHFRAPHSSKIKQIRDMVTWLKTGVPTGYFSPIMTSDGKSLREVCEFVLTNTLCWDESLLESALNRSGYSDDGGGAKFPGDVQGCDREEYGCDITEGTVLLTYWTGGFTDVLVPEGLYFQVLREHFLSKGRSDLADTLTAKYNLTDKDDGRVGQLTALLDFLPVLGAELTFARVAEKTGLTSRIDGLKQALKKSLSA